MVSQEIVITVATGLHARPAALFVAEAKKFQSAVTIKKEGAPKGVNAKSVMMVMAQGITCGTKVEISCNGEDENEAMAALIALIESNFGE